VVLANLARVISLLTACDTTLARAEYVRARSISIVPFKTFEATAFTCDVNCRNVFGSRHCPFETFDGCSKAVDF
jgi:hypothetical protein